MAKRGKGGFWGVVKAVIVAGIMVFFIGPVIMVAVYRFLPPPVTFLMVQRRFEGHGFEREWVPLERISPALVRAVIAAGLTSSPEAGLPDKAEVSDPAAFITEQFHRFLGREPGSYELAAFVAEVYGKGPEDICYDGVDISTSGPPMCGGT